MEQLHAMFVMARSGCSAREYRNLKDRHQGVLVGDNKGLYTAVHAANPITTKGEKRLTIDKMIMRDHLEQHNIKYRWTNAGHQLADGFTKLSVSGARSDLLVEAMETGQIRIHYSTVSGRKEAQQKPAEALFAKQHRPTKPRKVRGLETCSPQVLSHPMEFSLEQSEPELSGTNELSHEDAVENHSKLDELDVWYVTDESRHPSWGVECVPADISTTSSKQYLLPSMSRFLYD